MADLGELFLGRSPSVQAPSGLDELNRLLGETGAGQLETLQALQPQQQELFSDVLQNLAAIASGDIGEDSEFGRVLAQQEAARTAAAEEQVGQLFGGLGQRGLLTSSLAQRGAEDIGAQLARDISAGRLGALGQIAGLNLAALQGAGGATSTLGQLPLGTQAGLAQQTVVDPGTPGILGSLIGAGGSALGGFLSRP